MIVSDREIALMNSLNIVFPSSTHVLCIWHINKNILAKCKKYFSTEEDWEQFTIGWSVVVFSKSENDFIVNWEKFKLQFFHQKKAIDYVEDTWIIWKEKFVSAWIDKVFHLGNTATSRVEGSHSVLKQYISVSTSHLDVVRRKIIDLIDHQMDEYNAQLAQEKTKAHHYINIPFFSALLRKVSEYALRRIHNEYIKAKIACIDHPLNPCSGTLSATMGLPCSHQIQTLLQSKGKLTLDMIDTQWHLYKKDPAIPLNNLSSIGTTDTLMSLFSELKEKIADWSRPQKTHALETLHDLIHGPPVFIQEPMPLRTKGRPVGAKNKAKSSTVRDPSEFEYAKEKKISVRRCGICKEAGHNSRRCTKSTVSSSLIFLIFKIYLNFKEVL